MWIVARIKIFINKFLIRFFADAKWKATGTSGCCHMVFSVDFSTKTFSIEWHQQSRIYPHEIKKRQTTFCVVTETRNQCSNSKSVAKEKTVFTRTPLNIFSELMCIANRQQLASVFQLSKNQWISMRCTRTRGLHPTCGIAISSPFSIYIWIGCSNGWIAANAI